MKKTVLAVVLLSAALLSTGCAAEAVIGAAAGQPAAASPVPQVAAMSKAKEQMEAKRYTARVVPEHRSMMAGLGWKVSGGGWIPGAAVTVTLKSTDGTAVGTPAEAVADAEGSIDAIIVIPEGTTTGTYSIEAAAAGDTGSHKASVDVFSS